MASPSIARRIPAANRPYPPSWVDRLQAWLEASAWRSVALYVLLPLALYLAANAAHWWDGSLAFGAFVWLYAVPPLTLALSLGLVHYLDRSAEASLEAFRPSLDLADEQVDALRYRLTNLPARATVIAGLAGVGVAAFGLVAMAPAAARVVNVLTSPAAAMVEITTYVLMWIALATFMYHSKHQLFTVRQVYAHRTRVHVFRLEPLYSFSWLTGRTAVGLVAVGYLWFFSVQPLYAEQPYLIGYQVTFSVLALVVFVWPLWGVHRILVREKRRTADELGTRMERALERLYAATDGEDLSQMDGLNKLVATLTLARSELDRISTWPWRADTSRLLVTTLLLPLVVYIAQRVLAGQLSM